MGPPVEMARAQAPAARRALAARNLAFRAAEDRIGSGEGEHAGPELRAHGSDQLLQQPAAACRGRRAHSRISRPLNQPAASSALRASSAVR